MRQRGLTLLELLIALAATVLITAALSASYSTALSWQRASADYAAQLEDQSPLEDQLRELLESAYLSPDEADAATFFSGTNTGGAADTVNILTFTRVPGPPARRVLTDTGDFESRNEAYGPQGGVEEVSLSPEPTGDEAQGEGIFIRRQRPADGDPTQGGRESLFSELITEMTYEFYDGVEWTTAWDTRAGSPRRLPAAVRLTYRLQEEEEPRVVVIPLRHSDVTPSDPATAEGGEGA
jgi:prepilin-type N-terminal cleavage/methylation domain-containing protein